jgi:hypothetical protein
MSGRTGSRENSESTKSESSLSAAVSCALEPSSRQHVLQEKSSNKSFNPNVRGRHTKSNDGYFDLTKPSNSVFPPPKSFVCSPGPATPLIPASKAKDEFPFPLSPSRLVKSHRTGTPSPKRRVVSPPQASPKSTPDRFIPARRSPDSSSKSFRYSKSPDTLTTQERLVRHNSAAPDPFTSRWNSFISDGRSNTNTRLSTPTRPTATQRRASINGPTQRQPSAGAVWNVGGSVAATTVTVPITAVSDGRGGMRGSGTNAPIFTSDFFRKETEDHGLERFERRLAAALEIDQASRVLNLSPTIEKDKQDSFILAGSRSARNDLTVWRHGRWVNDRSGRSSGKIRKEEPRAVPITPFR